MKIQGWKSNKFMFFMIVFTFLKINAFSQDCVYFQEKNNHLDSILVCVDSLDDNFIRLSITNDIILEQLFSSMDIKLDENTLFYRSRLDSNVIDTLYSFDNPKNFNIIYESETYKKLPKENITDSLYEFSEWFNIDALENNIYKSYPARRVFSSISNENIKLLFFTVETNNKIFSYNIGFDLSLGFMTFSYFSTEGLRYIYTPRSAESSEK